MECLILYIFQILILLLKNNIQNKKHTDKEFYSDNMFIPKTYLFENHLKLTYQRQLISNLDSKHKEWSKYLDF